MSKNEIQYKALLDELNQIIQSGRNNILLAVNSTITLVYWQVGIRMQKEILKGDRAAYGQQVIKNASNHLTQQFGSGWGEKHLRHCMRFSEIFSDYEIVSTLCRQLSWSHFKEILYIEDELKRTFYIEICQVEKWSVRTFRERIQSMLYERTAISKKPDELIKKELSALRNEKKLSEDLVFRDPYILDFLELKDTYSEKDLESSILVNLQKFIGELGSDFAFLARQKRIQIDNRDYYIDLLFFHRKLKSLVAIDLKISDFDAAFKGEMELYLGYLQKYEMNEGENPPVGLILCSGKNPEHIEILQLDKSNIKVSEYLTILPPKEKLLEKLHLAVEIAKNNQERNDDNLHNNEL
jgi:predicted nuclease of restriction endonuclease-like (RecB) superfamily